RRGATRPPPAPGIGGIGGDPGVTRTGLPFATLSIVAVSGTIAPWAVCHQADRIENSPPSPRSAAPHRTVIVVAHAAVIGAADAINRGVRAKMAGNRAVHAYFAE